ncbi:hypothetical protein HELRODRAFT_187909 [Helobdella robusta]|uniref:DNA mismatch repair protein n=1 Tax=Helobdella robusta TaxID=6412 RepID=T1FPG7_HELRO|nr:hypothetical protein HELRODRAFT_187909 [Helobdella robusta]ESO12543.1 hypothetical protein HELRODRAFT_187909 [Helobdella robusta]
MAKTPKSADKKMKTIFSYFNKTPSEKRSALTSQSDQNSEIDKVASAPKLRDEEIVANLKVNEGDLVWAKMQGHPWWPSLVCKHCKEGKFWKKENATMKIHVQFFGSPPSRGWVKEMSIKPFTGSSSKDCQKGGFLHCHQAAWKDALKEADKALHVSVEARDKLVVTIDSSDDLKKGKDDKENAPGNSESMSSSSTPKRKSTRNTGKNKRRRIIMDSDEEEEAGDDSNEESFQPSTEEDSTDDGVSEGDSDETNNNHNSDDDDDDNGGKPIKTKKRSRGGKIKSESKVEKSPTRGVVRVFPNQIVKRSRPKKLKKTDDDKDDDMKIDMCDDSEDRKTQVKTAQTTSPNSSGQRTFPHTSFKFLQPPYIMDANRRKEDDPDYDPKTLYVPVDFLNKQTPAMKQWWVLKSQYFDTLLFFKMGKFYELFHMDAVIAVNELGLLFMKISTNNEHFHVKIFESNHYSVINYTSTICTQGDHAHCGFPEISYGRYSDILVQRGYKVARVEQTETPDQMQERCKQTKSSSKIDKVVRREICSVQSKGTKRSSFIDGDCSGTNHNFLLAIAEKNVGSKSTYGVCFLDVMIGKFYVGEFEDDRHGSRLRTLASHHPPVQVLYEKGKLSEKTKMIFNGCLSQCLKEGLKSSTEFWDATKTLKQLHELKYFLPAGNDDNDDENADGVDNKTEWPEIFHKLTDPDDPLRLTPSSTFQLALSALGATVWYLRRCLMDEELLSLKSFELYTPVDYNTEQTNGRSGSEHGNISNVDEDAADESYSSQCNRSSQSVESTNKRMVLDGVTLVNLDVLVNSSNGTIEGTLLQKLDSCKTAFGKRLIKQWLCSPLCNVSSINDRLDAMEDLMKVKEVTASIVPLLAKLPDLERLLNKIHTLGSSKRNKNHPDSRAVFFEDVVYSKRKIEDFLQTVEGFRTTLSIIKKFSNSTSDFKSNILKQCVLMKSEDDQVGRGAGRFPNIKPTLDFFDSAFDHQKARSAGVIKPMLGVNKNYDCAVNDIKSIEDKLNGLLDHLKKQLGCKTLTYFGTARNRYQVEVPEAFCRKISDDFEVTSQRKGFKRYQSEEIKRWFAKLMDAEDRRDEAQRDTMRCIFDQFDRHYNKWIEATQCIAVLDVLLSLSVYSGQSDGVMCRPNVVPYLKESFVEIRSGRHPCIGGRTFVGGDYIPNDTIIGQQDESSSSPRVLLVTGANMGGKSTLMRQVGLICLLAQLGCYVPAEVCRLTPVDRIFTRLGASDHIMSGESTFFVELSETSCVLQHATKHSLVLLDELGRGTATYDGNAIASAVLQELSDNIRCLTLFSTHYHTIVERFSSNRNVSLAHMACMVENEDDDDPTQETITFLFKLSSGNCPKSYGFNAARLAGIPDQVIREAHTKARQFEESVRTIKMFRQLWRMKSSEAATKNISSIISQI